MKANSLRDLYVEQLKDLYDAEHQLIKSLPKIAEASSSEDAPWIVVPANAKWYRNLVVAETLTAAMRPHRKAWRESLDAHGKLVRRDLKAWRTAHNR